MSDIVYESFCTNPACRFHNYKVPVGSKYLNYIDPSQFGEPVVFSEVDYEFEANKTYHVSTISRNWIYKNNRPLGMFCTSCARDLLSLPASS